MLNLASYPERAKQIFVKVNFFKSYFKIEKKRDIKILYSYQIIWSYFQLISFF
jgi:hypothetical protein